MLRHSLQHVPVLDDFASVIETENIYSRPVAIARPFLSAMQDDVIALGDDALEADALGRVLPRHPREIFDESFLAIAHFRVVLDVNVARVFFDSFGRLTLIEHQIVESHDALFVLLELSRYLRSFQNVN